MVNKAESVPASPAPRHIAMLIYPGVTRVGVPPQQYRDNFRL
jgi:hypothetical protein